MRLYPASTQFLRCRCRDPDLRNDLQPINVAPIELDSDLEEENNFDDDD